MEKSPAERGPGKVPGYAFRNTLQVPFANATQNNR